MPATKRQQAAANLDKKEMEQAKRMAKSAKLTLGNFIRVKAFGFEPLKQGRPKLARSRIAVGRPREK